MQTARLNASHTYIWISQMCTQAIPPAMLFFTGFIVLIPHYEKC